MRRALRLARKGEGWVSPNPMVGALLVKKNKLVASGYHHQLGDHHAEIHVLKKAGNRARGGHLFVTLEPCCHYGRTPPCTDAITRSGVAAVTVAMRDPNRRVAGKGITRLRKAGIKVQWGVLEREAQQLNEKYIKFITKKMPWVTLKAAITLDGYIAAATGKQRWISSPESREDAHQLRAQHDAILVGMGTVLKDNPQLSCRLSGRGVKPRQPIKVVLDSKLRTPLQARLLKQGKTLLFTGKGVSLRKREQLLKRGVGVESLPTRSGHIDIIALLKRLTTLEIASVLVEGGAQVYTQFLQQRCVDKVVLYVAPTLLGNGGKKKNIHVFKELGIESLEDAFTLKELSVIRCGADLCIEGYPKY